MTVKKRSAGTRLLGRQPRQPRWEQDRREREYQRALAEAVKPVLKDFPYTYESLQEAVDLYVNRLRYYEMREWSMDLEAFGTMTDAEATRRLALLESAKITFTVMRPEVVHLLGRIEVDEGDIGEVAVVPISLTRYVDQDALFEFVGCQGTELYTITALKNGTTTLNFEHTYS